MAEEYLTNREAFKRAYREMIEAMEAEAPQVVMLGRADLAETVVPQGRLNQMVKELQARTEAPEASEMVTICAPIHLESYDKRLTYFL